MRYFKLISLIALITLVVLIIVIAVSSYICCQPSEKRRYEWIQKELVELERHPIPTEQETNGWPSGMWACEFDFRQNRGYLLFNNDWAYIVYHTFHESEAIGDVSLLRAKDGSLYISDYHFCGGLAVYQGTPQPANLAEFLQKFDARQHWEKYAVSNRIK